MTTKRMTREWVSGRGFANGRPRDVQLDERLVELWNCGLSFEEIGVQVDRSPLTVRDRLRRIWRRQVDG